MGIFDVFHGDSEQKQAYTKVCESNQTEQHKAHMSHELISAAAAYEAAKRYEAHCAENGKPASHAKAKELIASLAAIEATKLIETKGLDHLDKAKAEHEAKKQAEKALEQCGDY
ncbi:hypothetical protein JCM3766R1_000811 [Sporobolomyces carnicolor]